MLWGTDMFILTKNSGSRPSPIAYTSVSTVWGSGFVILAILVSVLWDLIVPLAATSKEFEKFCSIKGHFHNHLHGLAVRSLAHILSLDCLSLKITIVIHILQLSHLSAL